ncbi:MAG: TRAP transporter fused permease subunit, partial [Pseudomonadota bacterium]
ADLALAALGLGLGVYVCVFYPGLVRRSMLLPWDALVIGIALFLLTLEGLRRAVGWTLVIVVLAICGYGLIGHLVNGPLQTRFVAPERLAVYLAFDANGLLGLTLMVASTVVVAFVFFGQLLLKSGGATFFNDIALALMGRQRGGAAKISIVASGLFGSISGVVVSNIVATGVVTIRLMKGSGFRARTAAAIEATASTGGQIVPPVMGAVAFLMADILQRPYSEIVLAAIVPALLYYVALFAQADLTAAKEDIAPVDEALIPRARSVLSKGWPFALPFVAIVYALFFAGQRPETAALWGAAAALTIGLAIGYGGNRMELRDLANAAVETGQAIVDIVLIAAAAGFIIGTLNLTGLGFGLTYTLVSFGEGSLLALLIVSALVCLVLGMGMPTVGVYLLLAVLVAPSLVETGVNPIAAHLFIFYLGMMSMVTPPVAIGAFFAASIAGASPMRTAFEAMRFGWTAYIIPFLFVASPSLLLMGPWADVLLAVVFACLGVYAISAAVVGYLACAMGPVTRIATGLAGALLLATPGVAGDAHLWFNLGGLALLAGAMLAQRRLRKRPNGVRGAAGYGREVHRDSAKGASRGL